MFNDSGTVRQGERDFPIGHPAAADYNGESYTPPKSPHAEDHREGHAARLGGNIPQAEIDERRRFESPEKATE